MVSAELRAVSRTCMALSGTEDRDIRADRGGALDPQGSSHPATIIAAIVILLIYQGYSLSVVGVASPWIAKSFALNEAQLAELFAWMSLSAFGALILARLADRYGRGGGIFFFFFFFPPFV